MDPEAQTFELGKQTRGFWLPTGVLSWAVLLGFIGCSFVKPMWAILFLLVFDLYWLLFLIYTLILFCGTQLALRRGRKINWRRKLTEEAFDDDAPRADELTHVILMPVSSASLENVKERLDCLRSLDYDADRIFIFFALAESAHPQVRNMIWDFHREHHDFFAASYISPFPDRVGEAVSTAANLNAATQMVSHVLERKLIDPEKCLVTCLDVNSRLDPQYLSCLSYHFVKCPKRQQRGFRPTTVCGAEFWEESATGSMWNLAGLLWVAFDRIHPYCFGSFARQSLSFASLKALGFWREDVVSDDTSLYWQAYYHFNSDYQVVPLYVPQVLNFQTPEDGQSGFMKTYLRNWQWAMGTESISRLKCHSACSVFHKCGMSLKLCFMQLTCTLWAFLFVFLGWLPGLAAWLGFYNIVAYYMAPQILFILAILSLLSFVVTFVLCCAGLPRFAEKRSGLYRVRQLLLFFTLPILLPVLSCVPLLDMQTRLIFKRRPKKKSK